MSEPGPIDRTTFFAEQRRNRRAGRISGFFCVLAILFMCTACSVVLTPFAMAAVNLGGEVLGGILRLPGFEEARHFANSWLALAQSKSTGQVALFYLSLVAPGVMATLGLWFPLRAMFRHVGLGSLLWQQTRKPYAGDLEEEQLENVVGELAIAAGMRAPELGMLDGAKAGAAAMVGTSHKRCQAVVSHATLEVLNRRQTQGLVGCMVASAANGDLQLALAIRAVFHALGVITSTFDIPFSKPARHAWFAFVKLSLSPRAQRDPQRVEEVSTLLLQSLDTDRLEGLDPDNYGCVQWILFYGCLFPWVIGRLFAALALLLVKMIVVGPLLGAIWRRRKYLSDATAVQLTRDPTAIAEALLVLMGKRTVTAPPRSAAEALERSQELTEADKAPEVHGIDPWTSLAFVAGSTETDTNLAKQMEILASFFPTINQRLRRLIAQGAEIDYTPHKESSPVPCRLGCLLVVVVLVCLAYRLG